jgi:hypothetical protein
VGKAGTRVGTEAGLRAMRVILLETAGPDH